MPQKSWGQSVVIRESLVFSPVLYVICGSLSILSNLIVVTGMFFSHTIVLLLHAERCGADRWCINAMLLSILLCCIVVSSFGLRGPRSIGWRRKKTPWGWGRESRFLCVWSRFKLEQASVLVLEKSLNWLAHRPPSGLVCKAQILMREVGSWLLAQCHSLLPAQASPRIHTQLARAPLYDVAEFLASEYLDVDSRHAHVVRNGTLNRPPSDDAMAVLLIQCSVPIVIVSKSASNKCVYLSVGCWHSTVEHLPSEASHRFHTIRRSWLLT